MTGNLALLRRMGELVADGSQFVVATHSPILMGLPAASIYQLGEVGFERLPYEETEHYQLTRSFLDSPERFLRHLLDYLLAMCALTVKEHRGRERGNRTEHER